MHSLHERVNAAIRKGDNFPPFSAYWKQKFSFPEQKAEWKTKQHSITGEITFQYTFVKKKQTKMAYQIVKMVTDTQ